MRVVLKLGGRIAAASAHRALELFRAGDEVIVVHGAGSQITSELRKTGVTPEFVDGRRVTGPGTLRIVRSSLVTVGAEVSAALGPAAIPLVGDEIGLEARPLAGLGLVGEPLPCRPLAIEVALAAGQIPVVALIAVGPLNVNADEAASALAIGLEANRIVFVSDVPGVFVGGAVAEHIEAVQAEGLVRTGVVEGGIVPKLLAAVRAARVGVRAEIGVTEVLA